MNHVLSEMPWGRPMRLRSRHKLYHPRPFFVSVAILSTLALGSWLASYLEPNQLASGNSDHYKRTTSAGYLVAGNSSSVLFQSDERNTECRYVRFVDDQCSFVKNNCPDEAGIFPYLQLYYCSLRHAKPVAFAIIIAWLSLLFSTVGIAASDFLCINLSTIASILGMSESLTGVTFLAFGNGSPDVFSTFAAMGSNSGSLAIGELIGAACFITAVVAGSMAVARPFRVARRSFVRDVSFFIFAAVLTLVVLADGELHAWECISMICLYVFYVILVVSWHWYLNRQRRKHNREFAARAHFHIPQSQELDLQENLSDDEPVGGESTSLLDGQRSPDFEALERATWPDEDEEDDETRNRYLAEIRENMRLTRPASFTRRKTATSIRPSLVGALEFQSVLSTLKKIRNNPDDTIDLDRYAGTEHGRFSPLISSKSKSPKSKSLPQQDESSKSHRSAMSYNAPMLRVDTSFSNAKKSVSTPIPVLEETDGPSSGHDDDEGHNSQTQPATVPATLSVPRSPSGQADHLTVPPGAFNTPNYLVSPRHSHASSLSDISPSRSISAQPGDNGRSDESDNDTIEFPAFVESPGSISPRPSLLSLPIATLSPTSGYRGAFLEDERASKWWYYPSLMPGTMFFALFPTLCEWNMKSIWAKILGIIAAPSVFFLTVTIPVVDGNRAEETVDKPTNGVSSPSHIPIIAVDSTQLQIPTTQLLDDPPTHQPGPHPPLSNETENSTGHSNSVLQVQDPSLLPFRPRFDSEVAAGPPDLNDGSSSNATRAWHRALAMIHVFTSPLFVIIAVWNMLDNEHDLRNLVIPVPVSLGVSLICAILLDIYLKKHDDLSQAPDPLRPILSFIGFLVGICWISILADEVVSLLKTLGVILNISDSLLGLTIFAVGNSLSDLVADITVARLGYPVMALSACIGGPMLNILLGIGIGGLYMVLHSNIESSTAAVATNAPQNTLPRHSPYKITISRNLMISGVTLLVTLVGLLIVVPLNHWKMDRKIGLGLIVLWSLTTLGNVIVELVT